MVAIQGRLTFLRLRRLVASAVTLVVATIMWLLLEQVRRNLGDAAMASGWALLISVVALYALGMRKRWYRPWLGPVAAWLQFHTYTGVFAFIVFCMHVGWPVRGIFEIALAATFVFISASGGWLLWQSRRVPRLLSAIGRDYRFEDIPIVQSELAAEAHRLVLQSTRSSAGATIAEYYERRLLGFFHSRRSWLFRCLPTGVKRRQLLRELTDLNRYLDSQSLGFGQQLAELVVRKDDTDFHRALQSRLRFLVACHVALTWSLLLMIVVHVVLVLRFQGAMV